MSDGTVTQPFSTSNTTLRINPEGTEVQNFVSWVISTDPDLIVGEDNNGTEVIKKYHDYKPVQLHEIYNYNY